MAEVSIDACCCDVVASYWTECRCDCSSDVGDVVTGDSSVEPFDYGPDC